MTWWEKLNKYLFWLALFVLPWQLRHTVLFADHQGEFFEYASISVYLSEILMAGVILTGLFLWKKFKTGPGLIFWPLTGLLIWMWVSVWYSQFSTGNWLVSVANASHFTIMYFFYLHLVNRVTDLSEIIWPLVWGMGFQSIIAIGQYVANHSLGLKYLGESVLDPLIAGIPVVVVNGIRQLRAHGTLPHANILGGWLAAILPWAILLYRQAGQRSRQWRVWGIITLGLVALFLSFSRSAWLAFGLILLLWLVWQRLHHEKITWPIWLMAIIIAGVVGSQYPALLSRLDTSDSVIEQESVISRIDQLEQFAPVYQYHPWAGVGLGQYTLYLEKQDVSEIGWHYDSALPGWVYNLSHHVWDYQPVHNIFLLVLAELGWVGESLFIAVLLGALWTIGRTKKDRVSFTALVSFLAVLSLGLFDHYLWTLQQGRLMLFLSISMIAVIYQLNRERALNHG